MKKQEKRFREWYFELSNDTQNNIQSQIRSTIIEECEISNATFTNWLLGYTPYPGAAKKTILSIIEKKGLVSNNINLNFN